jgi:hypothetical protein
MHSTPPSPPAGVGAVHRVHGSRGIWRDISHPFQAVLSSYGVHGPASRTYVRGPLRAPKPRARMSLALLCMGAHMSFGLPAPGLVCSRRVPLPLSLSHATNTTQHNHRGAGGAKGEDDARVLLLVEATRLSGGVEWSGVEGLSRSRVLVGFGSAR